MTKPLIAPGSQRRLVAMAVVAVMAMVATGAEAGSDPTQEPTSSPPAMDAVQEQIALAMADTYVVPLDTARVWAIAQESMGDLADALYGARPDLYGGTRIDHAAGTLVVNTTDPAQTEALLREMPEAQGVQVRVERASHTVDELHEIGDEVYSLMGRPLTALPLLDPGTNDVVVRLTAVAVPLLAAAKATNPSRFSVVRMELEPEGTTLTHQACSTTLQICDPPLRGGLEIAGPGLCTGAFVVRSRTDQVPYMLTAGHCTQSAQDCDGATNDSLLRKGTWSAGFSNLDGHAIGALHSNRSRWCYYQHDEAIIKVNNPSGWQLPRRTAVLVQRWDGTRPTARAEWYEINAVSPNNPASIPADQFLCITGAVHDTRCLRSAGVLPGTNFGLLHVDENFGTCKGDSGGPVYANHRGYGIHSLSWGQKTTHTRTVWWPGSVVPGPGRTVQTETTCVRQGGLTGYMSLTVALGALNVELIP